MLAEMSSMEISEWRAYFAVKQEKRDREKYEADLKRRAREG